VVAACEMQKVCEGGNGGRGSCVCSCPEGTRVSFSILDKQEQSFLRLSCPPIRREKYLGCASAGMDNWGRFYWEMQL